MPLRGLEYFSVLYSNYIDREDGGRSLLYGSRLIRIPTPRYYVFYNGTRKQSAQIEYRLSDAYSKDGDVEVIAHVININKYGGAGLTESCKPLSDYSELIYRIRRNNDKGMDKEEAVRDAVDSCIRDGILTDVLTKDKDRVISSLLTELTQEEIEFLREHEVEEGRKEGREIGHEEGLKEGREEGLKEGREEGLKEGLKEGREEGLKNAIAQKDTLFRLMMRDGRLDEYAKSVDDPELYTSLLKEYELI